MWHRPENELLLCVISRTCRRRHGSGWAQFAFPQSFTFQSATKSSLESIMRVKYSLKWLSKFFGVINKKCLFVCSPEFIFRGVNFYSLGETTLSNHRLELLGPACSHWPRDIKKQTLFLLGKLWWHSFSRHFLG